MPKSSDVSTAYTWLMLFVIVHDLSLPFGIYRRLYVDREFPLHFAGSSQNLLNLFISRLPDWIGFGLQFDLQ